MRVLFSFSHIDSICVDDVGCMAFICFSNYQYVHHSNGENDSLWHHKIDYCAFIFVFSVIVLTRYLFVDTCRFIGQSLILPYLWILRWSCLLYNYQVYSIQCGIRSNCSSCCMLQFSKTQQHLSLVNWTFTGHRR
jgi:hypothetical protein